MSRIIAARGPVVEALARYDPGLRVRWSHEKRKWAVDAPLQRVDERWCPPPVRWRESSVNGVWVQDLLPEYCERHIQHHDRRYVICWAQSVTWRLFFAMAASDTQRHRRGAVGMFDDNLRAVENARRRRDKHARDERVYEGYDRLKSYLRRTPWAEDGAGVSIKGMHQ